MKFSSKIVMLTLLATTFSSLSYASADSPMTNKAHVGIEYSRNWFTQGDTAGVYDNSLGGIGLKLGYRWTSFGVEGGYTWMQNVTYIFGAIDSQKNYNVYLDAQYFYPITEKFEFKALVGLGRLSTDFSSTSANVELKYAQIKPRIGAGIQYNFSDCMSMDVMYKLQGGNDIYKTMNQFMVGLNYHFG